MRLLLPATPAGSLAAFCRSSRSAASRNCAVKAEAPKAAIRLARRNVADYVVVRLTGLGQLRFLKGVKSKTRILAVAKPSDRTLNRRLWSRAVAIAVKDPTLDLAIAVDNPTQPTLTAFATLVRSASGGKDKTTLATDPVATPSPASPSAPGPSNRGVAAAPDTSPPSAPSGLTAAASSQTSVALAWTSATDDVGVLGYGVYRNGALAGSTALLTSTVPGLTCGTTYLFEVDAFDAAGNRSARTSVSRATNPCAPGADTTAPTAPANPAKTSGTTTSITVAWTASSDNTAVVGYGVYRSAVLQAAVTGTGYTFTGLVCGTTYPLAVDAYDSAGNRSSLSPFNAATSACPVDTQPPSVPQGMAATATSQTSISISWNASSDNVGVTGYRAYRDATLVGTTSSLTYAFSGLSCGTTYSLGVQAFDAAGNASYLPESILTSATSACSGTPPPPSPPPSGGAASVFVSSSGSDANACSQAAPCKTFDRAYRVAACGATVSVAGGTLPGPDDQRAREGVLELCHLQPGCWRCRDRRRR